MQIAETGEKQNISYACVINTKLKPTILYVRESYPDFEKKMNILVFKPRSGKQRVKRERK